ncbi:hypothetical protein Efla_005587 [Eimeria flavescens]
MQAADAAAKAAAMQAAEAGTTHAAGTAAPGAAAAAGAAAAGAAAAGAAAAGAAAAAARSVLLFDGVVLSGPSVCRRSLLLSLPHSSYVAIRTFRRGTRLLGVEANIRRLLISAASAAHAAAAAPAAAPAAAAAAAPAAVGACGPCSAAGSAAPQQEACGLWKEEQLAEFRARIWAHLRLLLLLFRSSSSAAAAAAGSSLHAGGSSSKAEEALQLPPGGSEAAVTVALTSVGLAQLKRALNLTEDARAAAAEAAPAAAAEAAAAAAAAAGGGPLSLPSKRSSEAPTSLHLVLLAEPLVPSAAIFCEAPRQQQQQQQQQKQQQQKQQQQGLAERQLEPEAETDLKGSSGSPRSKDSSSSSDSSSSNSSSSSYSSNSSSSSGSRVRWCNVMMVAHGGREKPEAKSTQWAAERQALLAEAKRLGQAAGFPIEEVLLENKGSLLEGCSSNFFVFSAARGCVLTAPEGFCLPGLVRGLALRAFRAHGLPVCLEAPQWGCMQQQRWTAAWISSSGRLLLPVRSLLRPKQNMQQQQQQQQEQQQDVNHGMGGRARPPSSAAETGGTRGPSAAEQQPQQQKEQQAAAAASCCLLEEASFAVSPDSLAARAAEWVAELAEEEAENILFDGAFNVSS